jgi:RecB family exonuclease
MLRFDVMRPSSLSASSVDTFLKCEARFMEENINFAREPSGAAADLGTVGHAALEEAVDLFVRKEGLTHVPTDALLNLFVAYAIEAGLTGVQLIDGKELLSEWAERTDFTDREVLMLENKERFPLSVPQVPDLTFPVTYIFDRLDRANGDITVVDYKFVGRPISSDDMRARVQPRIYALAAQLLYKDAPGIWVCYDLMRYKPVEIWFSKEENRQTYVWLRKVAERIYESAGFKETINPDCRYCVRRAACKALTAHVNAGGSMSIMALGDAIDTLGKHKSAIAALNASARGLEEYILAELQRDSATEAAGEEWMALAGMSGGRREVDSERASHILGPDIMTRYGKLTIGDVDKLLKGSQLNEIQKRDLRGLIRKGTGKVSIEVKPLKSSEED